MRQPLFTVEMYESRAIVTNCYAAQVSTASNETIEAIEVPTECHACTCSYIASRVGGQGMRRGLRRLPVCRRLTAIPRQRMPSVRCALPLGFRKSSGPLLRNSPEPIRWPMCCCVGFKWVPLPSMQQTFLLLRLVDRFSILAGTGERTASVFAGMEYSFIANFLMTYGF